MPFDRVHEKHRAGLCADCRSARRVESARGSLFYLCERSTADPAYRKYPRLPVFRCPGYVAEAPPEAEPADR